MNSDCKKEEKISINILASTNIHDILDHIVYSWRLFDAYTK